MTSSLLAGERRWASARRGGMTVLGKVTVPKPVNLPSQRLENHGMDPNVEIVPKGTLSWGTRSSSSTSNAWGSSSLSPNADGGTGSPSHLSGRPSSASGTRPSSSCSDRTHEPTSNAWGQNSRPSSASGALTSNQTALTSLRPRSAETRPGSSQLSRFAETSSDNLVAWGPTGVSEKLGVGSLKNDGFALSSGDFPTLGSEREISGKTTNSQDHGSHSRPGSSSRVASGKEKSATSSVGDISVSATVTVNTWRRDGSQHGEDGMVQPSVEKWQGDPPPYPNVPPQHFDAWHGPINPPPGVWYRGPPGGPPYPTPPYPPPGGFPMEPFPFYRPQIPPAGLANSQQVPPPGPGPRGHHPKNGDMYRPHMPEGYYPGMPLRPGFYPGPVGYEGYYGPPMGYCNPSERDFPFMGMPPGPPMYNRYPGENVPDPGNNHVRAGPHGPTGKPLASEQVESGHPDPRGPYKVLLKQHNECDQQRGGDEWEHGVPANAPYIGKGDQPRTLSQKKEWGLEEREDDDIYPGRRIIGGDSSQNFDNHGSYSSDLPQKRGKAKTVDNSSVKILENPGSTFSQAPQVFPATTTKDSTLIRKIKGLNAKVRASDGRPDSASIPSREEQVSRSQVVDAKVNHLHTSGNLIPASHEVDISIADLTLHPTASSGTTISRRAGHGVQGRLDHRGKRFNTVDGDGWRKKSLAAESTAAVSAANSEPSSNIPAQDRLPSVEAVEKNGINLQEKDEGDSFAPMSDPSDCQAQRAKMREIAKQRALQLQKEEEERTREQKAKALAKLEELNRRTLAMDGSTQKVEKAPPSGPIQQEQEECQKPAEQVMVASKSETPCSELVSNPNAQIIKSSAIGAGESTVLSNDTLLETLDNVQPKPVVQHDKPLPLQQDAHIASAANSDPATQVVEGNISRHKRMGYKQKHNISSGKNLVAKPVPISSTEAPKNNVDVVVASTEVTGEVGQSCESSLPMNTNITAESSAHQRRKNNKSSKSKHKLDDGPSITASQSALPKETNGEKVSTDSGKPEASELELDPSLVQSRTEAKHAIQPSPTEETSGRANNQWKSQHSRRIPKNQQASRISEKEAVIWAPVRSNKKAEFMEEASNRTIPDTVIATAKGDNFTQNNLKSKRAEMERYVPKQVAKELAQQGSTQQSVLSSVNQALLEDTVRRAEPLQNIESSQPGNVTIGDIVCAVEPRSGNGKLNKQSKAHGSFSISDPSKNIQKSIEQHQSLKPDVNSTKEKSKPSDDCYASDGWNTPENSDTAASVSSATVNDQGVIGRGKRHPFKGHKSMGNSHDHDHRNASSGDNDKSSPPSPAPEIGQTDKIIASKENRGGERTTSHWQPKSQVSSFQNQRGNRSGGGQSGSAEVSNAIRKVSPSQDKVQLPPHHNQESREHMVQPSIDNSQSEQKNVAELPNVGHQEFKREKKGASFRGRPNYPNQSSGRGHESRGDRSLAGHDHREHNTSSNKERYRHNSHYEYQPIGEHNYNKPNQFEGPTDGSHNSGSKYRERSQGHSRRGGGNFYSRQGGTIDVDASYD